VVTQEPKGELKVSTSERKKESKKEKKEGRNIHKLHNKAIYNIFSNGHDNKTVTTTKIKDIIVIQFN
jgi:hypothetical protein